MRPEIILAHEFVEVIPESDDIKERTLYVSRTYGTAVHKCCCGCGSEVVTPLSPAGWQLESDGQTVSLYPSIGSWSLPCQSHYFIRNGKVLWASRWSREQIEDGRAREARARNEFYKTRSISGGVLRRLWQSIKNWLSR